ncbi:unnamed protein product [Lasius platythorax]|uniref:Uncharacterized protein n=1 Tax=Lasius platythorax TaxID=488582 RepID=A0AAV2NRD7_9HYME
MAFVASRARRESVRAIAIIDFPFFPTAGNASPADLTLLIRRRLRAPEFPSPEVVARTARLVARLQVLISFQRRSRFNKRRILSNKVETHFALEQLKTT